VAVDDHQRAGLVGAVDGLFGLEGVDAATRDGGAAFVVADDERVVEEVEPATLGLARELQTTQAGDEGDGTEAGEDEDHEPEGGDVLSAGGDGDGEHGEHHGGEDDKAADAQQHLTGEAMAVLGDEGGTAGELEDANAVTLMPARTDGAAVEASMVAHLVLGLVDGLDADPMGIVELLDAGGLGPRRRFHSRQLRGSAMGMPPLRSRPLVACATAWHMRRVSSGEGDRTSIRDVGAMVAALQAQVGASKGGRHLLVRMNGANMGRVWSLADDRIAIGRATGNDILVDDDGTSRQHAILERHDQRFVIIDQGSSNGTYVNGERVDRHILADADLINLGPACTLRYTRADAESEALLVSLHRSNALDHLTETYNDVHFGDVLARELSFARRHGTALSLLVLDVDHFRSLNDEHGYEAGDAVLKALAERVRAEIRLEDVLARTAGGSFSILLRATRVDQARALAERLRETVAGTPFALPDDATEAVLTVSIACASLGCVHEKTAEALRHLTQRRMQQAKRNGRNCVVFREPATRKPMPSQTNE